MITKSEKVLTSSYSSLFSNTIKAKKRRARENQKTHTHTHTPKKKMADLFCRDCNKLTEVVFDHSAGDTICSECGLVLEAHSIDETSEWRTFANESNDHDPARVGGPVNPLLSDGGLSTVISKPNGTSSGFLSSSLGKWQTRGSNSDRHLIEAFKAIAIMSDRFCFFILSLSI